MTSTRITAAIAALSATAVLAAGCGGSDSNSDSASSSAAAKKGGVFTGYYTSFPDYLDPALSYTADGWTTLSTAYTGLLAFAESEGAAGAKIVPGLAEALPTVSDDGKTYTLTLRKGLKYSDGTAVKASDFQHTIQRILKLESGGSAFYLNISGAKDWLEAGDTKKDISGITTDDATGKIEIKLDAPNGQLENWLAIPFAGLVPGNTKFDNLTLTPPPSAGPYMVTDVKANQSWKIKRNPNFTPTKDIPAGSPDEVDITVVKNQRRQVADVLANKVDFVFDPPTPDLMARVRAEAKDRFKPELTNSTYYYFLNEKVAPFNDLKVRQAVNFAVDKRALQRFFGGLLAPSCNFLPPGMEGFKKIEPCPYGDPTAAPNLEKAKQLVKEAGAEGTKVTVYGNSEDPSKPVTEYLADVLNQIGLKATPKILDASVYFQTIGNQKTKAQAGFANWFQDYPHPGNFMFLVNGESIQNTNNQNFGNVDDPEINKLIDEANVNPSLDAVAGKYAEADKLLVERAYVVPYGNRQLAKFTSDRVNFGAFLWSPVFNQDLTTLSLK